MPARGAGGGAAACAGVRRASIGARWAQKSRPMARRPFRKCFCRRKPTGGRYARGKTLLQRGALLFRQEEHRDECDHVDAGHAADGEREAVAGGDDRNDHRGRGAADEAARIVQRGLRRAAHLGGEQLGDERAVAADHTVGEHAHEEAADQKCGRVGQLAVDDDHNRGADLEGPEGGTTAGLIGEPAEHGDADHHADDGDGGPHAGGGQRQAQAGVQVLRQPGHDSEVAGVLHGAQDDDQDGELGALGRAEQVDDAARLLALGLMLLEDGRLGHGGADDDGDDGRHEADDEQALPAERGDDGRGSQRGDQHADLEAQAHGGGGLGAVFGAGNLGGDGHAQTELGADAQARAEAAEGQDFEAGGEGTAQGEHAEEDDRVGEHLDAAELVGQRPEDQAAQEGAGERDGRQHAGRGVVHAERCDDAGQREAEDHQVEAVERVPDGSREHCFPGVVLHFRS